MALLPFSLLGFLFSCVFEYNIDLYGDKKALHNNVKLYNISSLSSLHGETLGSIPTASDETISQYCKSLFSVEKISLLQFNLTMENYFKYTLYTGSNKFKLEDTFKHTRIRAYLALGSTLIDTTRPQKLMNQR